jgi:hypothetical protein
MSCEWIMGEYGLFKTTVVFSKRSKMPDYCGRKVMWKLIEEDCLITI